MPYYMYVSLQDDDKIRVFTMDGESGQLTPKGEVPVSGGPSPLTISPDRKVLYVGHRNVPEISSFRIDPDTGGLDAERDGIAGGRSHLSVHRPQGPVCAVRLLSSAQAGVHPVGDDGTVGGPPIEWLETDIGAHAMQTDPSNQFAFVPHIAGNGPNVIFQFRFDENTGHFTPNSPLKGGAARTPWPPPLLLSSNPRHPLLFQRAGLQRNRLSSRHFDGNAVGFSNDNDTARRLHRRNTYSQIQISSSGKFLYVPNRGHNSIAGFSVDTSTGRLTAIGQVSTEAVPAPSAWTLRAHSSSPPARSQADSPRTASTAIRVNSLPWRLMLWASVPCGCW